MKCGDTRSEGLARLRLRTAGQGDLAALTFFFDTMLRKDYFLRRGQLAELLEGSYHDVYIAEIDSVLVGIAVTTRGTRLVNALIHPAYRGLGIGRALVEHSGASEVRVKLDMSGGNPRRFYESLGFKGSGQRNAKGNIEVLRKPGTSDGKWNGRVRNARRQERGI